MRRRTMISELAVGDTCETDCLLIRMTQRITKSNGSPYVELILSDGVSVITARKFRARIEDIEAYGVTSETVVRVVLAVDTYYEDISYIVCDIWSEDCSYEYLQAFLPKAHINMDQAFSKLVALIRLNSGAYTKVYAPIGRLAEQVLIGNRVAFCHSAGGVSRHHNRIGGLLEHSLGVATEASRIAEHPPELDGELLVAGAALHDAGKIYELHTSLCGNIEYTKNQLEGGHPVIGMKMIDETVNNCGMRFDHERVRLLKHIVGAHHGRQGTGNSLTPAIPEARLVQLIDALDATLDGLSITTSLSDTDQVYEVRSIEAGIAA